MKKSENLYRQIKSLVDLFSTKAPAEGLEQAYMSSARDLVDLQLKSQYVAFEEVDDNEEERCKQLESILEQVQYIFNQITFKGEEIECIGDDDEFKLL